MDLDLRGVHVLVTGAGGGIGLEATRIFLEQGANVTAHYRSSDATLLPLFATYGLTRIRLIQADLSSEPAVISLFSSKSIESFGPIEIAVVNHGAYVDKHVFVKDMSLAQWEKTMSNNLTSSFLVVREYLKGLEKGISVSAGMGTRFGDRAAITLVGSTAGKFGEARHTDYAASKSAMMYGFTMSLKNEIVKIAPRGRVNCVAPGWTKTPMAAAGMKDPTQVGMALATTPLKKIAEPADVANQIVLLSSAKVSGHVTGQCVMVEGGMEGRLLNPPP